VSLAHSISSFSLFQVRWDGRESVFVSINADLKGKMCGLCGFNDGDKTNDFKTAQGTTVTSADKATFGNSWKQTAAGSEWFPW
jgi:hypothetical protein